MLQNFIAAGGVAVSGKVPQYRIESILIIKKSAKIPVQTNI
jgi:hypothetical protein